MSNPYLAGHPQPHPQATTVLVLSIVGFVLCPVVSVVGLVLGNRALREIDANPAGYLNRSTVATGRLLSLLGVVLWTLTLLAVVGLIALARPAASP